MKVLIISDVHANYGALQTVLEKEPFDKLIFLGDAVDYGPQPTEVVDSLYENADFKIMGNHDYAVINDVDCKCAPAMHHLSEYSRINISKKLMAKEDIEKLKSFKRELDVELDGMRLYMTHASPNNNLYGYLFSTEAEMVTRDIEMKRFNYIMIGHTHFPMFYKGRILNPGSAGQPRDGNWKPWYATLDTSTEQVQFKRFDYDYNNTIDELRKLLDDKSPEFKELTRFYLPA